MTGSVAVHSPGGRGFNVIGHVTGGLGLGQALRNTLSMLGATNRPFVACDVDPGLGRQGLDSTWTAALSHNAPFDTNWFHVNPPEAGVTVARCPALFQLPHRRNIAVPFWELPRLPRAAPWREWLGMMDLVLAPSRFIYDAVRRSVPQVHVVHFPQAVALPVDVHPRRVDFGLPDDSVLFYHSADLLSDLRRKNSIGVVRAFLAAFPESSGVGLVLKLSNTRTGFSWADGRQLLELAGSHANIFIVDRALTYRDTMSLMASCDVTVSLHRAEGLGLSLLEAAACGQATIATGWSGNMDFTTDSTSILVGFDLVPVSSIHPGYSPGYIGTHQHWAEPREVEAVRAMQRLVRQPAYRSELGRQAHAASVRRLDAFLQGSILPEIDRTQFPWVSPRHRVLRRLRWNRALAHLHALHLQLRLSHMGSSLWHRVMRDRSLPG